MLISSDTRVDGHWHTGNWIFQQSSGLRVLGCTSLTSPITLVAGDLPCLSSSSSFQAIWQSFESSGLPLGTAHPAGQKWLHVSQFPFQYSLSLAEKEEPQNRIFKPSIEEVERKKHMWWKFILNISDQFLVSFYPVFIYLFNFSEFFLYSFYSHPTLFICYFSFHYCTFLPALFTQNFCFLLIVRLLV